jgi:pimeloyl-ACP methyl ester carboxylesterase
MTLRARTLAALPVTDTRRQVAGIPTAVLEGGDGPPLVLLHGPGEFAALWGHVIPDLVTTHRVIAPDLPGHGDSGLPDGRLDTRRVLTWIRELVDATCDTPPDVAGHLLGGAVAARFAAAHPDRVRHLVLVDTFGLRPTRPAMRFLLPLLAFTARPTERSRDRFLAQCFVDFDAVRAGMGDTWEAAAAYELAWARSRTGKKALRSLMPRFGLRRVPPAELAGIRAPTSLVWGRHDLQTPLRVAETASARYGWPLHVIDACGDDPFVERPREALTSLRSALDTSAGRGVAS